MRWSNWVMTRIPFPKKACLGEMILKFGRLLKKPSVFLSHKIWTFQTYAAFSPEPIMEFYWFDCGTLAGTRY